MASCSLGNFPSFSSVKCLDLVLTEISPFMFDSFASSSLDSVLYVEGHITVCIELAQATKTGKAFMQ